MENTSLGGVYGTQKLPSVWSTLRGCSQIILLTKDTTIGCSLLQTYFLVSKVLERHIYSLLMDSLIYNNILSDNQYGFRKGRSTLPLLFATNDWHTTLDQRSEVAMFSLTLTKLLIQFPTRLCSTNCIILEFLLQSYAGLLTTSRGVLNERS